jgi:transcriptional antiterminator NusG
MDSWQEICRHGQPFLSKVSEENAGAQRIIDSQDRAAMCQFEPCAALEVLAGCLTSAPVGLIEGFA